MSVIRGKLKLICLVILGLAAASMTQASMAASMTQAAPKDGQIIKGKGTITQSGRHTDIHQQSHFMATQWQNFNIAANESVEARQPGTNSRLLIRVDGSAPTNIAGRYSSNGITILENRAGVQFSQGAIVNVGGLLATSAQIDESTLAGNQWRMSGVGGAVVNHGDITAGKGGAILAAVRVENRGNIIAQGGDVALGAGSGFTIDFSANGLIGFEVSKAAGASLVNTGRVKAEGGIVRLTAREARALRANVVSVGGEVEATRLSRRGGVVYLSGGEEGISEVSGTIKADEKIEATSEKYVVVKTGAHLTAPEILVGGDFQGKGNTATAQRTLIEPDALLDAGPAGRVIVWSDEKTWFYGELRAAGGFAEISGKRILAHVNFDGIHLGEGGTLLLDPYDITIGGGGRNNSEISDGMVLDGDGCAAATCTSSENYEISVREINLLAAGTTLTLAAQNDIHVEPSSNSLHPFISHSNLNLTLTAGRQVNINNDINVGAGKLTISAGGTTALLDNIRGTPATSADNAVFTLTAAVVEMTAPVFQNRLIANVDNALASQGRVRVNINSREIILNATAADTAATAAKDAINADETTQIIAPNAFGSASAARSLTVNAQRNISIAASAAYQYDNLTLKAGLSATEAGTITFAASTTIGAAGLVRLEQDGALFAATAPATFEDLSPGSAANEALEASRIIANYTGTGTQTAAEWHTLVDAAAIDRTAATGNLEISSSGLVSETSITLTVNTTDGIISFSGTDDVVLIAPIITITASWLQAYGAGRNVIIHAEGGTLTIDGGTLIETPGSLSLLADTITFGSSTTSLSTIDLSLTQASPFGSARPATLSATGTVSLYNKSSSSQTYYSWMDNTNYNNLILRSDGDIDFANDAGTIVLNIDTAFVAGGNIGVTTAGGLEIEARGDLTLTGNSFVRADPSTSGILITSEGDLNINMNIDVAEEVILKAGFVAGDSGGYTDDAGAINFAQDKPVSITTTGANDILLTATKAPTTSNQDLTIHSGRNLIIEADINTGTGDLSLEAGFSGYLAFSEEGFDDRAVNIEAGGEPNSTDSNILGLRIIGGGIEPEANLQTMAALTITSIGNFLYSRNIITQGAITFTTASGGMINGGNSFVKGASVTMLASFDAGLVNSGSDNITITASGDIIWGIPDTDLFDGRLTLTAGDGDGTGAIHFTTHPNYDGSITIRDGGISLIADGTPKRQTREATHVILNSNNGSGFPFTHLLTIAADLSIASPATVGTGGLILTTTASNSHLVFQGDPVLSASRIVINNRSSRQSTGNATLRARGDVSIQGRINMTGNLILEAGRDSSQGVNLVAGATDTATTGAIVFVSNPSITAATVSLTFNDPARLLTATAPANFNSVIPEVTYDGTGDQTRHDWFVFASNVPSINIDAGAADIIITDLTGYADNTLNLGVTNTLYLETTGDIIFPADGLTIIANTITLIAANITAPGDAAITGAINIRSLGQALTLSSGIKATGDVTLTSAAGLIFGGAAASGVLEITGAAISLSGTSTSSAATNRAVSVMATGDLTVTRNISTGTGDLTLSAGGTLSLNQDLGTQINIVGGNINISSANEVALIQNLRVRAFNNLTLNASINTNAIVLTAGRGDTSGGFIFATERAITLTAASETITLTSDQDPTTSGAHNISIASRLQLNLNGSLTTTGMITLDSASGGGASNANEQSVVLGGTNDITITAGTIKVITGSAVIGDSIQGSGVNAAFIASGNIDLTELGFPTASNEIDLGGGNLTLEAGNGATTGSIVFSTAKDLTLRGGTITLIADAAPTETGRDLTIIAVDDVILQTSLLLSELADSSALDDGDDLSITATNGRIMFGGATAITLHADDIRLTAAAAPDAITSGGADVTLRARHIMEISASLNAGAGALTLEHLDVASAGAVPTFANSPVLSGGNIVFMQDGAFTELTATTRPTLSPGTGVSFTVASASDMAIYSWMVAAGKNLTATNTGTGSILIAGDLALGAGRLALTSAAAINFSAAVEITANRIRLSAATATTAANLNITLTAEGRIDLAAALDAGTGNLTLIAGGRIDVDTAQSATASGNISMTAGLNVNLYADIDAGTGNLTLIAGNGDTSGAINFTADRTLGGNDIALTADLASGDASLTYDLTAIAANDLSINADLQADNLLLEATAGSINFATGKAVVLNAATSIAMSAATAPTASNQNLTIMAGAATAIDSSLDTGSGDLTMNARLFNLGSAGANLTDQTGAFSFKGQNISLTSGSSSITETDQDFTIEAKGNILLTGGVGTGNNADAGDFTITAGAGTTMQDDGTGTGTMVEVDNEGVINFGTTRATVLQGGNITLNASATSASDADSLLALTPSNQSLTITAQGDILINSDIDLGTASILNMRAGAGTTTPKAINFSESKAVDLKAVRMNIASAGTPTASNKDLTITATSPSASNALEISSSLNTGTGALTIESQSTHSTSLSLGGAYASAPAMVWTGGEVSLISAYAGTNTPNTAADLTIQAADNLNIDTSFRMNSANLTLMAGTDGSGALQFSDQRRIDIRISGSSGTVTLDAPSAPRASNQRLDLTMLGAASFIINSDINTGNALLSFAATSSTGALSFSTRAVTLTASGITLDSFSGTPTASAQDVTLIASTDIVIEADIDLGTAGILSLEAGSGAGTGTITFGGNPTLTAASILLRQDGAVFPATQPDVTFTIPNSGQPEISYVGGEEQGTVNWATFQSVDVIFDNDATDIDITALTDTEGATLPLRAGQLLLGGGALTLTTTGDIIIPADGLTVIAGTITLTANSIKTADGAPINGLLALRASSGDITLTITGGGLATAGNLEISALAGSITLAGMEAITSTAGDVELSASAGSLIFQAPFKDGSAADDPARERKDLAINGRDITLVSAIEASGIDPTNGNILATASRNMRIDVQINTGIGNLNLTANAMTIGDLNLKGARVVLNNSGATSAARDNIEEVRIESTGRIHLFTDIVISGDIIINAAGQLRFTASRRPDEVAANRARRHSQFSGGAVSFTAASSNAPNHDLSITAAGALTIATNLDVGGGTIRLTANDDTDNTTISAITFTGTPELTAATIIFSQEAIFTATNDPSTSATLAYTQGIGYISTSATVVQPLEDFMTNQINGTLNVTIGGRDLTIDRNLINFTADNASDLTLISFGKMIFYKGASDTTRIEIRGNNVTLTSSAVDDGGNQNALRVRAENNLTVNANINTGSRGLILVAARVGTSGALQFGSNDIVLTGSVVNLTTGANSAALPVQSSGAVNVTSTGNININAHINITGALSLGSTAGAINFSTARDITLNGESVSLSAATAPTVSDQSLTITSGNGDININTNIDTGTGNLVIFAGAGDGAGSAKLNIANARTDDITLAGHHIRLEAEAAPDDALARIIITSATDLVLYTDLDAAASFNITLTAGNGDTTGSISVFGARTFTGTAILFSQDADPFLATKLADFVVSSGLSFTYTGTQAQEIHDWMIVSDANLTVSASGDIRVNTNIAAGTGQIALTAGRAINFSTTTTEAITITGSRIALTATTAPTASDQALTIDASGALVVNTNLNTGSANLVLEGDRLNLGSTEGSSIFLDGADITLTSDDSDAAPVGTRTVTVRAADDLTIEANIDTGDNDLSLFGGNDGTGRINFADTDVAISGGVITLSAPSGTANNPDGLTGAITLTAKRNLNIQANIFTRAASGNVILIAGNGTDDADTGAINFSTARAITISVGGGDLTLTADAKPRASNQILSVETGGNVMLGADLNTGTGDLELHAGFGTGTIIFTGDAKTGTAFREIQGGAITLNGDAGQSPAAYDGNIRIRARAALTINADINAGSGNLVLTGGRSGTGTVQFGALAVILTGNDVSLNRARASTDSPTQSAGAVTVTAGGNILVNTDIDTSGNLTLTAGDGDTSTGAINFTTARAITLNGAVITLTADAAPTASNQNLAIIATGDLTIKTDLNVGSGTIDLQAGRAAGTGTGATGAISWDNRSRLVTADIIKLTQDVVFATTTAPANFGTTTPLVVFDGTGTQTDHSWLNVAISYTSPTTGDVVISTTLTGYDATTRIWDLGSGTLTISTDGNIIIPAEGLTIIAGSITLTAAGFMGPSGAAITGAITITSAAALAINHSIATSGDLTLTAGTTLTLGTQASNNRMSLQGQNISLTSDTTMAAGTANDRITITADDDITIAANLDGGTAGLRLFAGDDGSGAINFTGTSVALSGASVTLSAPTAPTTASATAITATTTTGDLLVLTNINTTGDLTLTSGARLRFDKKNDSSRRSLLGAAISLTSSTAAATGANRRVTIRAEDDLTIAANLNGGSFGLRLFAGNDGSGNLIFTGTDVALSGASVLLSAPTSPESATNITATAAGTLTIATNINTTGNLTLTATAGAINFDTTKAITLMGADITLAAATAPTASGQALTVTSTAALVINTNLDTGTANSSLTGGTTLTFGTAGTGDITISGQTITLVSDTTQDALPGTRNVIFSAQEDLSIGANIDAGEGDLKLESGADEANNLGEIIYTGTSVTLAGANITLEDPDTSKTMTNIDVTLTALNDINIGSIINSGTSDLTLTAMTGAINFITRAVTLRSANITLTAAATVASNQSVTLIAATGALMINTNLNTGTNDLTLSAGTTIQFGAVADRMSLLGQNISLTSSSDDAIAADRRITINAANNIEIGANLDAGSAGLRLFAGTGTAGTGVIDVMGDSVLSGAGVLLSAPAAPDTASTGALTATARTGALTMRASINTTGDITLTSTAGAINFTTRPITLNGADITLAAATAPTASGQALTITATGALAVNTNLNTGTGNLMLDGETTLTLGSTTGNRIFLDGANITLTSDSGTAAPQGERRVTVRAANNLTIAANIDTGTARLGLTAGSKLNFANTAVAISGGAITLVAPDDPDPSTGAITVTARGDLNIQTNISTSGTSVNVILRAGNGEVLEDHDSNTETPDQDTQTGAINFPKDRGISLSVGGGDITLTADSAPTASDQTLVINAFGNVMIGADINTGTGDLTLTAGFFSTGTIIFTGEAKTGEDFRELQGRAITLNGDAAQSPAAYDGNIRITAQGNLSINADINAGNTGNIVLTGGQGGAGILRFGGGAVILTGNDVSLITETEEEVASRTGALTVTAAGNILVGTTIRLTGALALNATGVINFGTARTTRLTADGGITLTSSTSTAPTASGQDLNLFNGRNAVTISASLNVGDENRIEVNAGITFSGSPTLTAGTIELSETVAAAFPEAAPAVILAASKGIIFAQNVTGGVFTVRSWMIGGDTNVIPGGLDGKNLVLSSGLQNIILNDSINLGSGDLTLIGSNIQFGNASGAAITLQAGNIQMSTFNDLTAVPESMRDVTVMAQGNITFGAEFAQVFDFDMGSNDITLTAGIGGAGKINFIGAFSNLSAGTITLTAPDAPDAGTGNISLTASGDLNIQTNLNTSRDITLAATGKLNFNSTASPAVTTGIGLDGANITLTSGTGAADAGNRPVTIRAANDLTVGANINTGTSRLRLVAGNDGTGKLNFTGTSVALSGTNVRLSAPDAPVQSATAITATATGNLEIRTSIDTTGDLTLIAGNGEVLEDHDDDAGTPDQDTQTGAINFFNGRAITLNGAAITLTADTAPTPSNQDLIIIAAGALGINTDLNAGTAAIDLQAGRAAGTETGATGAITWNADTLKVTAALITLTQDGDAFAADSPADFNTRPFVIYDGTATQTAYDWFNPVQTTGDVVISTFEGYDPTTRTLDLGGSALVISTTGNIIIPTAGLTIMASTITLTAAGMTGPGGAAITRAITITSAGALTINHSIQTSRNINLTAGTTLTLGSIAGSPITLAGRHITLTSGTQDARTGTRRVTFSASGDITIGANIDTGTARLRLFAGNDGTGRLNFTGTAVALSGGNIALDAPTAPVRSATNIMVTAAGTLSIRTNISTGGTLDLTATGVINFGTERATTLTGSGGITLTSSSTDTPTPSGQDFDINNANATGSTTITANLNVGNDNAIRISGNIIFSGTPTLTAGTIRLIETGGAFPVAAPEVILAASKGLNFIASFDTGSDAIPSWMIGGDADVIPGGLDGKSLEIRFDSKNLILNDSINLGSGDLALVGSKIQFGAAAGDAITLAAGNIQIVTFSDGSAVTESQRAVIVMAQGDISSVFFSFGSLELALGSNDLTMTAGLSGTGRIIMPASVGVYSLTAGTITLTAPTAPPASNAAITLTASGDLNIQTNINTSGDLTLAATGNLNFDGTGRLALLGANVSLTGGTAAATPANRRITIRAADDLTIGANIDAGSGGLRLYAGDALAGDDDSVGALNFTGTAVALSGAAITLSAPTAPTGSDTNITVTAAGDLLIATSIETTGTLSLTATTGVINFGTERATRLAAVAGVTLTGSTSTPVDEMPAPSGQDLTIDVLVPATGSLITIDANLNVGSENLIYLRSQSTSGDRFVFNNNPTLNAGTIRFQSDGYFPANPPRVVLMADEFIFETGAFGSNFTIASWMIGGNANVMPGGIDGKSLTFQVSSETLIVNDSINVGSGALTLKGRRIQFGSGAGAAITLTGRDIQIGTEIGFGITAPTSQRDVTVTAQNNIMIGNTGSAFNTLDLDMGTRTFALTAGGQINWLNEGGNTHSLIAGTITMTAPDAPDAGTGNISIRATARLDIQTSINTSGDLTLNGLSLNFNGGTSTITLDGAAITLTSGVAPSADDNDRNVLVRAASGLSINANIDTGDGFLRLSAGTGVINFTGENRALSGRAIRLGAPNAPASANTTNITLTATDTLDIRSGINTSGNLTLTSTGGGIVFTTARDITLNGADITLTANSAAAPRASNKALTITATGALVINTSLNTGSANPTLTAGTVLTFGTEGTGDIIISGRGIALSGGSQAALPAGNRNRNVIFRAENDISIGANINAGTGNLEFSAGKDDDDDDTDQIRYTGTSVTLAGSTITLSDTETSKRELDIPLTLTASSDINIGAIINTGTADLTLSAGGAINFSTTRAITLRGANITLTAAAAPVASNQNLTLNAATGALMINTHLDTGTSAADNTANLTLSAGTTIQFGAAAARRSLQGQNISLTSGSDNAIAANGRITIRAADNITVDANISAGTAGLRLYAGDALAGDDDSAGAINFTGASALSGGSVTLSAPTAPTASAAVIEVTATTGDLFVLTNINTTGNLTLDSDARLRFDRANDTSRRSLLGANISLTSGTADAMAANRRITIRAEDDITVAANLNAGTEGLRLFAGNDGAGKLNFSGTSVALAGAAITLSAGPDAATSIGANTVVTATAAGTLTIRANIATSGNLTLTSMAGAINFSTREITLDGADITLAAATAPVASNQALTITASGALVVDTNLNTGTGALMLTGGTTLTLGSTSGDRIFLDGANITLTSGIADALPGMRRVTVRAADNLTIAANINTGTARLGLTAGNGGAGVINFAGASVDLKGGIIALTAPAGMPTASNTAVTLTATGNLAINADINTGRDLTLTAGDGAGTGAINFSNARAITLETVSNIRLNADAAPRASDQDLSFENVLFLIVNTNLDAGSRNIALQAEVIAFGVPASNEPLRVRGNDITIDGSAAALSQDPKRDLIIEAANDINFQGYLNQEANDVTLNAGGALTFATSRASTILGENITLNAGTAPAAASDQNLVLTANGDLNINTDLNTGTGASDMALTAGSGSGTGAINFSTAKPITITTDVLNFISDAAAVASHQDLTIDGFLLMTGDGGINIGEGLFDLSLGSGLTFVATKITAGKFDIGPACAATACIQYDEDE